MFKKEIPLFPLIYVIMKRKKARKGGNMLEKIQMVVFDIDGTLTDGKLIRDNEGNTSKNFYAKDGFAIGQWLRLGKKVGIITGKKSKIVEDRAKELGLEDVIQGSKNKAKDLEQFLQKYSYQLDEIAYMGDDINDLGILRKVGFSACPQDAAPEVLAIVDFVAARRGGEGAARDLMEYIMKANGMWKEVLSYYLEEETR